MTSFAKCPRCGQHVMTDEDGKFKPHAKTAWPGGRRCAGSGKEAQASSARVAEEVKES